MDWSLVPSFLAVADNGSLSGAARATGISQPTLGRHIRALEEDLGAEVFRRVPRGLELTEAGAALIPSARAMAEAAAELSLVAAGRSKVLEGPVRITASVFVAQYLLPPVVASIGAAEPGISIELVASDSSDNLLFREADIALRMYRPTQLDVITRHVADIPLGLFAATAYAEKHGVPKTPEDLLGHRLVGYDRDERIVRGMRAAGLDASRTDFATRCDNQTVYWELVRAGCGIGFGQVPVARQDRGLVPVLPDMAVPPLPVWLTAHEALRQTPRIRRVWDLLAEGLDIALS